MEKGIKNRKLRCAGNSREFEDDFSKVRRTYKLQVEKEEDGVFGYWNKK